ncbi:MAG: tRNA guanosine(34) transglycosylase Tgt [Acidobacteria bacterium]|nr:tRNA guanosine(34) transglycosylase Tgt [Acidobacteriota bacterium]
MKAIFEPSAHDGLARSGVVHTARGTFTTPCFIPVGTRGAVKFLSSDDLASLGAEVVLGNTYHLMLRPGADVVAELGGLHGFANWNGHVLTDSGGYQIFSLEPEVDDEGALFRSTYDGSRHHLSPESAVEIQAALGSDIQMALDVCPALPGERGQIESACNRTTLWAERAREAFVADDALVARASQFGIVQGGIDPKLRMRSAEQITSLGFDGYAVGGLSVGEPVPDMLETLAVTTQCLPADQPRYFMGLGDPIGIVESIGLGVDMFDCVLPTRLARHGTALTSEGRMNIKRAEYARDDRPLDPQRPGGPCAEYPRGYLRHLVAVHEPTAARLLTMHNLWWLFELMSDARSAIEGGYFASFKADVVARWS